MKTMLKFWIAFSALILQCDGFLQCRLPSAPRNLLSAEFRCSRHALQFKFWTEKSRLVTTSLATTQAGNAQNRRETVDRICSVLTTSETQPRQAVEALEEAVANGCDLSETEWEIVLLNCQRFPEFAPLLKAHIKSENVSSRKLLEPLAPNLRQ
jgi:hypothetical protein